LKQRLREQADNPPPGIVATLRDQPLALKRADVDSYRSLPVANGRLRVLQSETVDAGAWRLLWLPPALPYYAGTEGGQPKKTLVFSAWNLAPDSIAALLSYEAERRMMGAESKLQPYSEYSKRPRLLRFSRGEDGRLTGMPVLTLLYPCIQLAILSDPLQIAIEKGRPLSYDEMRAAVRERLGCMTELSDDRSGPHGIEDQHWYWAVMALLDTDNKGPISSWCMAYGDEGWLGAPGEDELFTDHVREFVTAF